MGKVSVEHIKSEKEPISNEYLKNEYRTNKVVAFFLLGFIIVGIVNAVFFQIDGSDSMLYYNSVIFIPLNTVIAVMLFVARKYKYQAPWIKYMLLCGATLVSLISFFMFTTYTLYLIFIPIFISTRYFDKKIITAVSIVTAVLFVSACLLNVAFGESAEMLKVLHENSSYNPWQYYSDAVVFIMTPVLLLMIFSAIFAVNMTNSGRKLLSEKIENNKKIAAVDAEIGMGAQIQRSVLPKPSFTSPNGFIRLFAYEMPAKEVCGDFYDYFMINDSLLAVLVADVSDKGIPAAMFMMSAKKALQCALVSRDNLEDAIALANKLICNDNEYGMFLTLWMCIIDTESGVGKYVNAGHPYPIIKHGDGTVDYIENSPCLFIGNFPEKNPQVHTFKMQANDILVIYTDGLTDSLNQSGESFGIERAFECVKSNGNDAEKIGLNIAETVNDFSDSASQFDDITILSLQCNKTAAPVFIKRRVAAGVQGTTEINNEIQKLLTEGGCPDDKRRNIGVAVDEICNNISEYAYTDKGDIDCCAVIGNSYLEIEFIDGGVPFNPLEVKDPNLDNIQIGGLGIYLVKKLSDKISYEYSDNKNKLKILFIWNM